MRFLFTQTLLLIALTAYVLHATDREWRALAALRFSRDDPRPAWHEVETRFRELSHWCLQQNPPHTREQRRAASAFRYLRNIYAEEMRLEQRVADWLLNRRRA